MALRQFNQRKSEVKCNVANNVDAKTKRLNKHRGNFIVNNTNYRLHATQLLYHIIDIEQIQTLRENSS